MTTSSYRPQLAVVDGTFAELAKDLASFVGVGEEVKPLLAKDQEEEALAMIVKASIAINSAPEKDITAAYGLLIHLVIDKSKEPKKHLPQICSNLLKPITSSPMQGPSIALNALQSMFNLLDPTSNMRYNVMQQIIKFVKMHGLYDNLKGALKNLPRWLENWDADEEAQRNLYMEVAELALEADQEADCFQHILKALGTFDADDDEDIKSEEAQKLSLRALRMALLSDKTYDFQNLRVLPSVQALSESHPVYSQLLGIFSEQELEDYIEFREEHEGWIEKENLDHEKLQHKMRILTFASLAASQVETEIEYAKIAKALKIDLKDVEVWTLHAIMAGLVEGKMNQATKQFKVHRTTFRVFGEKQWRNLSTRLDNWKRTMESVLAVVRHTQQEVLAHQEREQQEMERKLQNAGLGEGGQHGGRGRDRRHQPPRNDNDD